MTVKTFDDRESRSDNGCVEEFFNIISTNRDYCDIIRKKRIQSNMS